MVDQIEARIAERRREPLPELAPASLLEELSRQESTAELVPGTATAAQARFLAELRNSPPRAPLDPPQRRKGIAVRQPYSWKPPYQGSAVFGIPRGNFQPGDASRLPPLPGGPNFVANPSDGTVGANVVQEHDGDVAFDSASTDFIQECLVGNWIKTASSAQTVWANISLNDLAFGVVGSTLLFGSGQATLDSWVILEAWTGSGSVAAPAMSSFQLPVEFKPPSIDGDFTSGASSVTRVPVANMFLAPGTWIWLMAGTAQELAGSVTNASLTLSISALWTVNSISAWL